MRDKMFLMIVTAMACFFCILSSAHSIAIGNEPIRLQLNWTPDPTFAGAYLAADKNKNFFAQEGLSVEIQPGGFGIDPIAAIIAKSAEFAIVGADKAAIAFSNGAPIRVVAVEFQRNPVGWIVRKSKNINNIKDAVGRNDVILGDKTGTETTAILNLMLRNLNIENKISSQPVGFDFAFFLQNENSIYPVYLNEEPVTAKVNEIDIIEIDPSKPENGDIHLYGNVIITHENMLQNNRKIVTAFLSGLKKGWIFAKTEPDNAKNILLQYKDFKNKQTPEVLTRSVHFATVSQGIEVPPGHMEISQWINTLKVLKDSGLLKKDISIKDFVWFGGDN